MLRNGVTTVRAQLSFYSNEAESILLPGTQLKASREELRVEYPLSKPS